MLFYSRPKAEYAGKDAKIILLDFYLVNTELSKDGNKVKAYVQFKGRAIMFKERGELLLLKFAERLVSVGTLESMPKLEGKRMFAIFAPKSQKKK